MKALIIALIALTIPLSARSQDILTKMTFQERFYLKKFFKKTIYNDHWGFALFFDKPVSLTGFFLKCPTCEIAHPYGNKLMKKGWKVWKKVASAFPTSRFILCEEIDPSDENPPEVILCKIYLINKHAFLKVLYDNLTLFKSKLGEDFSPEKVLSHIENTKTLTPHLNHDEGLLGIVLGFEVESSLLFGERAPTISQTSLRDQFLQLVCSTGPPKCKIQPVAFLGNPQSLAVQKLLDQYSTQTPFILDVCRDPHFLEIVFNQFYPAKMQ